MPVPTPLRALRRFTAPPAPSVAAEVAPVWHVGLSRPGMFPEHEIGCPCAKARCGLAVPGADVPCPTHQGPVTYRQAHRAGDCVPHKWFHRHPAAVPRPRVG